MIQAENNGTVLGHVHGSWIASVWYNAVKELSTQSLEEGGDKDYCLTDINDLPKDLFGGIKQNPPKHNKDVQQCLGAIKAITTRPIEYEDSKHITDDQKP